jgi:hypothetical protein
MTASDRSKLAQPPFVLDVVRGSVENEFDNVGVPLSAKKREVDKFDQGSITKTVKRRPGG